jgi:hypothetical protein
MSVKLFITIDTEEDLWDKYQTKDNPVSNIDLIPILQEIFDEFSAIPTYLINYPVANDEHSKKILGKILDAGKCEIGTHCHPWNTPPFDEILDKKNSMICNLKDDLLFRKMSKLHNKITSFLGQAPICFRAGRWGFSSSCAKIIDNLGYKIDTSISPFIDWSSHLGPNFSEAPFTEYRFSTDNILTKDPKGTLLEVPPTIGFLQNDFLLCQRIRSLFLKSPFSRFHILGILERIGMLNRRWLSPELISFSDMIKLSKIFIKSGATYLNLSFHSTTLLPGCTPFVRDKDDLSDFLLKIRKFLEYAKKNNFKFEGISGALVKNNKDSIHKCQSANIVQQNRKKM